MATLFDDADFGDAVYDNGTSQAAEELLREWKERAHATTTAAVSQPAPPKATPSTAPPEKKRRRTTAPAKSKAAAVAKSSAAAPQPPTPSTVNVNDTLGVVLPPVLKTFLSTAGGYYKGDDAVLFRATYPDAAQLGSVLASLHGVLSDFELYFDARTGLKVVGMNDIHTMYVDVEVPASSFAVFNLADDTSGRLPTVARFSVSAKEFYSLRSEFTHDYTLTMCALLGAKVDAAEEFYLQLHPGRVSNANAPDGVFAIPQFEGSHDSLREIDPAQLYQFRLVMRTSLLKEHLDKWARYSDIGFRLTNRGVDVLGFDGEASRSGSVCINYTGDTSKDSVLSAYKVFHGASDADANTITQDERNMLAQLAEQQILLVHLDRLVRRTTQCAHLDCLLDEPPLDELTGQPTREPRPTCQREEMTVARLAQIDNIRLRMKFVRQAMATLCSNSDFIELFLGRKRPPEDDEYYPLLMRGRVLNAARDRVLISRVVYVSVCLNEK